MDTEELPWPLSPPSSPQEQPLPQHAAPLSYQQLLEQEVSVSLGLEHAVPLSFEQLLEQEAALSFEQPLEQEAPLSFQQLPEQEVSVSPLQQQSLVHPTHPHPQQSVPPWHQQLLEQEVPISPPHQQYFLSPTHPHPQQLVPLWHQQLPEQQVTISPLLLQQQSFLPPAHPHPRQPMALWHQQIPEQQTFFPPTHPYPQQSVPPWRQQLPEQLVTISPGLLQQQSFLPPTHPHPQQPVPLWHQQIPEQQTFLPPAHPHPQQPIPLWHQQIPEQQTFLPPTHPYAQQLAPLPYEQLPEQQLTISPQLLLQHPQQQVPVSPLPQQHPQQQTFLPPTHPLPQQPVPLSYQQLPQQQPPLRHSPTPGFFSSAEFLELDNRRVRQQAERNILPRVANGSLNGATHGSHGYTFYPGPHPAQTPQPPTPGLQTLLTAHFGPNDKIAYIVGHFTNEVKLEEVAKTVLTNNALDRALILLVGKERTVVVDKDKNLTIAKKTTTIKHWGRKGLVRLVPSYQQVERRPLPTPHVLQTVLVSLERDHLFDGEVGSTGYSDDLQALRERRQASGGVGLLDPYDPRSYYAVRTRIHYRDRAVMGGLAGDGLSKELDPKWDRELLRTLAATAAFCGDVAMG